MAQCCIAALTECVGSLYSVHPALSLFNVNIRTNVNFLSRLVLFFFMFARNDPNSTYLHARITSGGHTAWSRAWLVNLRARLFQGTEALNSLRGIMRDQCVGSLYSLHPALSRSSDKKLVDCTSCYESHGEDKTRSPSTK